MGGRRLARTVASVTSMWEMAWKMAELHTVAPWAGAEEAAEVDMRIARIKAELYCELAAVR
jgi:hypothetical protein